MDLNKPGALVLTDWFDASKFNPGSVGVYHVNSSPNHVLRYSYWDGENWCMGAGSVDTAHRNRNYPQKPWSAFAVRAFRGLKNKPE
jgi:hypothetical protein